MKLLQRPRASANRGSLLVPIVAAMAILGLAGIVLSQSFSAQRVQSVLAVESSRAFWVAEAGAWHSAMIDDRISPAVSFDSGSYVSELVTGTTNEYVILGQHGQASRRVDRIDTASGNSGPGIELAPRDPIDEAVTMASAGLTVPGRFALTLYPDRDYPAILTAISFTSADPTQYVSWADYGRYRLWPWDTSTLGGPSVAGTVVLDLIGSDPTPRIVPPSPAADLEFAILPSPLGLHSYAVTLHFSDGTESRLDFSIDWK